MERRFALLLCLAAVLPSGGPASAQAQFDGQYVGDLTLTKWIDGDCTPPPDGARYPLTVAGGQVKFVYAPRYATTLVGAIDAKGNFAASARLKKGSAQMTGKIHGSRVDATIVTPSCVFSFQAGN